MEYIAGGVELLERTKPLWEQLNAHHIETSMYFSEFFEGFSFESRMKAIRALGENIYVIIAVENDRDVGYALATLEGIEGEVASLYVEPQFRGSGMGGRLMEMAKAWLREQGATTLVVMVAYGNEQAFKFYAKHGFLPRATRLVLKETEGQ